LVGTSVVRRARGATHTMARIGVRAQSGTGVAAVSGITVVVTGTEK